MRLFRRRTTKKVAPNLEPEETKLAPTPEELVKVAQEYESKLLQLEQKTFMAGVDSYTKWLETSGCFLSEQSVFTPADYHEPKEVRKFAKAHTLAGLALEHSLAYQPHAELMIDEAHKNRAKTIFVERFPQIIDIVAKTNTESEDKIDYALIDDVLHSFVAFSEDEETKNPFIEQVETEKSMID